MEIFFSYHVNDGRWKGVFERHFEQFGSVEYIELNGNVAQLFHESEFTDFDVAFFIISEDYLSMPMVENGNLEESISNLEQNGTKVVLVHAEHCEWQKYPWIKQEKLWPNYANALADDWGYPEKLNRQVSELISGLLGDRKDFTKFLTEEKKWPPNYIQDFVVAGPGGKTRQTDLSIIEPNSRKIIAIIEFKTSNTPDVLRNANRQTRFHRDALNQPNILGYIVCPAKKNTRYPFDIYQLSENLDPEFVTMEEFPEYEELKQKTADRKLDLFNFRIGLDLEGSEICDKLIDLVANPNIGLAIDITHKSFINLRSAWAGRKTDNVVIQIHRYGEPHTRIALAIAGVKTGATASTEPELNTTAQDGLKKFGCLCR